MNDKVHLVFIISKNFILCNHSHYVIGEGNSIVSSFSHTASYMGKCVWTMDKICMRQTWLRWRKQRHFSTNSNHHHVSCVQIHLYGLLWLFFSVLRFFLSVHQQPENWTSLGLLILLYLVPFSSIPIFFISLLSVLLKKVCLLGWMVGWRWWWLWCPLSVVSVLCAGGYIFCTLCKN